MRAKMPIRKRGPRLKVGWFLNLIEGGFSDKIAGEWLLKQLSEDEITALTEVLIDDWAERQDDILSREWDER